MVRQHEIILIFSNLVYLVFKWRNKKLSGVKSGYRARQVSRISPQILQAFIWKLALNRSFNGNYWSTRRFKLYGEFVSVWTSKSWIFCGFLLTKPRIKRGWNSRDSVEMIVFSNLGLVWIQKCFSSGVDRPALWFLHRSGEAEPLVFDYCILCGAIFDGQELFDLRLVFVCYRRNFTYGGKWVKNMHGKSDHSLKRIT